MYCRTERGGRGWWQWQYKNLYPLNETHDHNEFVLLQILFLFFAKFNVKGMFKDTYSDRVLLSVVLLTCLFRLLCLVYYLKNQMKINSNLLQFKSSVI